MSSCITTMRRALALGVLFSVVTLAQVSAYIPDIYDPFTPNSDPGEISQTQIIVRFTAATASRMHAERIGKGLAIDAATTNTYAPDVDSFDPQWFAEFTPSLAASAQAEAIVSKDRDVQSRLSKSGLADKEAFNKASKAIENEADKSSFGALGLYVVKLATGKNPIVACREMMQRSDVIYAEPSRIYRPTASPNDANFFLQWNLRRIGVPEAWDLVDASPVLTTPSQVGVVVIDTGVRVSHKDLTGIAFKDLAIDVVRENGDAYAQDDPDLYDDFGHGTAVAGIILSQRNNATFGVYPSGGIAGVASNGNAANPGFVLYTVNAGYGPYIANWWDGVFWFENSGATAVNMSFGSYGGSPLRVEVDAMRTLATKNMLAFVSSGNNDGNADITFPAALSTAISVGGVDTEDLRVTQPKWWYGSNYGETLDIMGLSQADLNWDNGGNDAVINGNYSILALSNLSDTGIFTQMNGTSAASPHVTGVAAMMKYVNPALSATQIRNILYKTAQDQIGDPAEDTEGFDIYYGHGLVNALAATEMAMTIQGLGGDNGDDRYEVVGTFSGDEGTSRPLTNDNYENARDSEDILGKWLTEVDGPGVSWNRDWYKVPVFFVNSTVRIELFHHRADGRIRVSLHHPDTHNTLGYVEQDSDYAYFDRKVPTNGEFGIKVDGSLLGSGYDMRVTVYDPGVVPPPAVAPEGDSLEEYALDVKRNAIESSQWSYYP